MKLSRITRAFTWLGQDPETLEPIFSCQGQVYGDRVQLHSLIARRPGALSTALPLLIDDARAQGLRVVGGYMQPFTCALLKQTLSRLGIAVDVEPQVVLMDAKEMQWVTILL